MTNEKDGLNMGAPTVHIFGGTLHADKADDTHKDSPAGGVRQWRHPHGCQCATCAHNCGNTCGGRCCGRHHRHGSIGGLVVLFIGIALLSNTLDFVSWAFWHTIAPLWPVLLIAVGVQLVFGYRFFGRVIGFLIAFALFSCVVLYGLVNIGSPLTRFAPPEAVRFIEVYGSPEHLFTPAEPSSADTLAPVAPADTDSTAAATTSDNL